MSLSFYMHVEVIRPVRQMSTGFPSPVFVDVAESAGEKGRLLVGRMEEFCKKMSKE